jgi:hypothetical protein
MAALLLPLALGVGRIDPRRATVVSSFAFGAAMLGIVLVDSYAGQLVTFSLSTAFGGVTLATVTAAMAGVLGERRRLVVFRWGFVAFLCGQAIANIGGSVLVELNSGAFGVALVAGAVVAILMGVLRTRLAPVAAAAVAAAAVDAAAVGASRTRLRWSRADRAAMGRILLLGTLVGAFSALALRMFNLLLVEWYHVPIGWLGFLLALDRVASVIGILALAPLLRRYGTVSATAVLLVCVLPLQALQSASTGIVFLMVPYLLRQSIYYSQMPVLDLVTNQEVGDPHRAAANGMQKLGFFGGSALAAQLYGVLLGGGQYAVALVVSGVFAAAAGVVYLVAFRARRGPQHANSSA